MSYYYAGIIGSGLYFKNASMWSQTIGNNPLSLYPLDCVCFYHLLKIQYITTAYVCPNERYNLSLYAHSPPPLHPTPLHHPIIHATHDIKRVVKKLLKTQQCYSCLYIGGRILISYVATYI